MAQFQCFNWTISVLYPSRCLSATIWMLPTMASWYRKIHSSLLVINSLFIISTSSSNCFTSSLGLWQSWQRRKRLRLGARWMKSFWDWKRNWQTSSIWEVCINRKLALWFKNVASSFFFIFYRFESIVCWFYDLAMAGANQICKALPWICTRWDSWECGRLFGENGADSGDGRMLDWSKWSSQVLWVYDQWWARVRF